MALVALLTAAPALASRASVAPDAEVGGLRASADIAALDAFWPLRDQPAAARGFAPRLERALRASPDDPELLWRAARWYAWRAQSATDREQRKREGKLAWHYAERALEIAPDSIPVRYWAALSVGAYGQSIGALAALRQGIEGKFRSNLDYVIEREPTYDGGSALLALGRYYFEMPWPKRDMRKAERYLELALKVNPDNLRAKLYLAEILAGKGEAGAKRALAILDEVLAAGEGSGDGPERRQVQRMARTLKPKIEEKTK
jgi:tetratricopeptide (TPR) repeat protein